MDCFVLRDSNHPVTQKRSHPLLVELACDSTEQEDLDANKRKKQRIRHQVTTMPSPLHKIANRDFRRNYEKAEKDPVLSLALPQIDKNTLLHLTLLRALDMEEVIRFCMISDCLDLGLIASLSIPDEDLEDHLVLSSSVYGVCLLSTEPYSEQMAGTYLVSFQAAPGAISLVCLNENREFTPVTSESPWSPDTRMKSMIKFFQNFSQCEFAGPWMRLQNIPVKGVSIIRVGNESANA
jgi:hypothetical protein